MSFLSSVTSSVRFSAKGFTLIELLVTVAIFIFMTALIVSRYGAFNQGTLMTDLAYDLALSVRTAQTYGVSVKGIEDTTSGAGAGFNQTFTGSYGVHFDNSTPAASHSFLMFVDSPSGANANNMYDAGETILGTYNIKQGATISIICASTDGGTTCPQVHTLDVAFKRPDPSAIICASGSCASLYNFARITLTSADGTSGRTVVIRGNGQISVGN